MMRCLVFYGSYRSDRAGIAVAEHIRDKVSEEGHDVELIDAKEYDFGILDKMYKEFDGDAPEKMKELSEKIEEAESFILISGEYNHSIQPGLSNLLDHFQQEFIFKPSAIVAYSPSQFGGARAAMQLRAFMPELGSISIPSILYYPASHKLSDQLSDPETKKGIDERFSRFIKELSWYSDALSAKRNEGTPY